MNPASPKVSPVPVVVSPLRVPPKAAARPGSDDEFVVGGTVKHPTFGIGTIARVDGEGDVCRLRIEFGTESKTLLAKFVTLAD
jgi:hypothetical protein